MGSTIKRLLSLVLLPGIAAAALTDVARAEAGQGQTNAMSTPSHKTEIATLGGGCFWCLEALYQMVPGVKSVTSGFAGGTKADPSYEEVCRGDTGHAEVVQIEYDPSVVSYEKLLDTFWAIHDPTTLNRQGHDVGTQYRSIILYSTPAQKTAAERSKAEAQKQFSKAIVTEIVPLNHFYKAEDYHQNYFRNHPDQGYCNLVIRPKVEKFEKQMQAAH